MSSILYPDIHLTRLRFHDYRNTIIAFLNAYLFARLALVAARLRGSFVLLVLRRLR